MDRTERVELATICLVYKNNKVLLQNRVKEDWKGYALPGGHIEPGESVVESVIREVKEETGLDIRQFNQAMIYKIASLILLKLSKTEND